jgi:hypothetical protein
MCPNGPFHLMFEGLVTLLRLRETYEKRMKINEIFFIRTKIPCEIPAYEYPRYMHLAYLENA